VDPPIPRFLTDARADGIEGSRDPVDVGWGGPAPADDGEKKFWNKKASDRRRPRKGGQVGGSATGHIAKDGDAWGTKKQYYKDDDGNWQSYEREGPLSELY
jgi:hypothetical protein